MGLLDKFLNGNKQEPANKQAIDWIKANNRFGSHSQLVKDMTDLIEDEFGEGNVVSLTFGTGLMKSGTAHQIWIFAGEFFAFEFSMQQAKQADAEKSSVTQFSVSLRDRCAAAPAAKLESFDVDDAESVAGIKPLTGKVSLRDFKDADGKYALRLFFRTSDLNHSRFFYLNDPEQFKTGTAHFEFGAINKPGDTKIFAGPLVAFLNLCSVAQNGQNVEVTLYSNTVATLLNVV
ncbi:MAG: hypothetical protein WCA38_07795 [Candidatus Acidiferrales bacterium]